jgi:hypothetical protein
VGTGLLRARVLSASGVSAVLIDGRASDSGTYGRSGVIETLASCKLDRVAVVVEFAFSLLDPCLEF